MANQFMFIILAVVILAAAMCFRDPAEQVVPDKK